MQARTKFISVCVKHPCVKCELYGMRNAKEERGNWWGMKEGEEKDDETIEWGSAGLGYRRMRASLATDLGERFQRAGNKRRAGRVQSK